jgi:RsiW-degrading membrane proteinase PrsW (M82 family)
MSPKKSTTKITTKKNKLHWVFYLWSIIAVISIIVTWLFIITDPIHSSYESNIFASFMALFFIIFILFAVIYIHKNSAPPK